MFFKKYNTIWAEFFTYEKCRIDYSINKKEEKNVLTIACASKIKVYCNIKSKVGEQNVTTPFWIFFGKLCTSYLQSLCSYLLINGSVMRCYKENVSFRIRIWHTWLTQLRKNNYVESRVTVKLHEINTCKLVHTIYMIFLSSQFN